LPPSTRCPRCHPRQRTRYCDTRPQHPIQPWMATRSVPDPVEPRWSPTHQLASAGFDLLKEGRLRWHQPMPDFHGSTARRPHSQVANLQINSSIANPRVDFQGYRSRTSDLVSCPKTSFQLGRPTGSNPDERGSPNLVRGTLIRRPEHLSPGPRPDLGQPDPKVWPPYTRPKPDPLCPSRRKDPVARVPAPSPDRTREGKGHIQNMDAES
jgi:hypothetical protein